MELLKCPHCGAQWKLPPTNNFRIERCPFCQGDMCIADNTLTTIESVLKAIVSRFGVYVLSDGEKLLSLFEELAPSLTKEKCTLKFFVECGGHTALSELQNATHSEQELGCQKQIQAMVESITEVCNNFLSALGVQYQSAIQDQATAEYEYAYIGNDSAELTLCKNTSQEEIKFPSQIAGKKVISISGNIFGTSRTKDSYRSKVRTIHIPEGITRIDANAFRNCRSLSSVVLPQSLIYIGENAFRGCKSLTNIVLPDKLTTLDKGVFADSHITNIVIPDGVELIPAEAFQNCRFLTKITLPKSVKYIGKEAFSGCKSITSVGLSKGLVFIEDNAFEGCKSLTNVILPNELKTIGDSAFAYCDALNTITLPDSITNIKESAFLQCLSLDNVTLPKNITTVNSYVFERCYSLTKVYIPEGVKSIENNAFLNCDGLNITIPKSVINIAKDAIKYCNNVTVYCYEGSFAHQYAQKKKWAIELL